jgi:hypothetical protein
MKWSCDGSLANQMFQFFFLCLQILLIKGFILRVNLGMNHFNLQFRRLKASMVFASLILSGILFQRNGPEAENQRSPE